MSIKTYLHDRFLFFLTLILTLLTILHILLVVVRVDTTQRVSVLRYNTTQTLEGGFERGPTNDLYQLAVMPVVILIIHVLFAYILREKNRTASIYTLALGVVGMVFSVVVSSALLNLHR
jgi:uncharacterized BrkB/YihY/UPF0761 family membrane protein